MENNLYHPSAAKLLASSFRADLSARSVKLEEILEEMRDSCRTWAKFAVRSLSFRVSIPDVSTFNSKVALNLM
jgi:hypothetical protein